MKDNSLDQNWMVPVLFTYFPVIDLNNHLSCSQPLFLFSFSFQGSAILNVLLPCESQSHGRTILF